MEYLIQIDGDILLWIQENIRNDILTPFFRLVTHLGDHGIIWILLAVLFLCFKKTRRAGVLSLLSLAGSFVVNNLLLKNIVARTRPYEVLGQLELLIEKQRDLSFPSGHAASSFAMAYLCFKVLPHRYGICLLALAGLIALSRLYLGVHYPSDVLFGSLFGIIIAGMVAKLSRN